MSMKIRVMITILLTACILLYGCGKDTTDSSQIVLTTGFEDGELFYVGESKCYVPEANVYIRSLQDGYDEIFGDGLMSRTVGGVSVEDKLNSMAFSRLAEVKALGLLARERDVKLTEQDNKKCSQATERYWESLSDADRKDLEITPELLLSMYEDYALACKVYDDITKDVNPEISDDEARIITIQRILLDNTDPDEAMKKADAVYSMISEGSSFDSLIGDYNEAEDSTYSFDKDTDEFSPEFVHACFDLSTGEISSPLITDEGLSIVKCISSYDMERTDANKARMVEKRKREAFDEVYSAFVKDLYTNFNTELWDSQKLSERTLDSSESFFDVYEDVFRGSGIPLS